MSMAEHNSEYLYKIAVTGKNIIQDGREFWGWKPVAKKTTKEPVLLFRKIPHAVDQL
jgi:hypothetical protein